MTIIPGGPNAASKPPSSGGIIYTGQKKYLWTLQELYNASIANLGPMDTNSYDGFMRIARQVAKQHRINNPLLVIDISLKEPNALGVQEYIYPISKEEWDIFVNDSRTMAKYMPNVHVVDGDKYTAPI